MSSGIGIDVIVLETLNGELCSTEFLVRFHLSLTTQFFNSILGMNRTADWRSNSLIFSPVPPKRISNGDGICIEHAYNSIGPIHVYVNDLLCPNIKVCVEEYEISLVNFIENDGSRSTCPSHNILKEFNLRKGQNKIKFQAQDLNCAAHFDIYYWDVYQKVIVCDIDGTLTKADVKGYIETVYCNKYSYIHEGVVGLLKTLESELNFNIIYLTTRPIEHLCETKNFLEHLEQNGSFLPSGPLFTNKKFIGNVIYDEIFIKDISSYKLQTLQSINSLYRLAGLKFDEIPFKLGFGNRVTDARAYFSAGILPQSIFIISPSSLISVWNQTKEYKIDMIKEKSVPKIEANQNYKIEDKIEFFNSYGDKFLYSHIISNVMSYSDNEKQSE